MAGTNDYKQQARECLRLAQETKNEMDRRMLLQMAETWFRLSEQAEKRGSK